MLDHSCQVQRHPLSERGNDLYETPPEAMQALLRVESIPHCIWEPAAGRGAIVRVLRDAGHAVIASDLVNYGFPLHFTADFLTQTRAPAGVEGILTNPPFKDAARFVAKALELCPRVFMLMRLAFFEAGELNHKRLDRHLRSLVLDSGTLARIHVFRLRLPMMHRDQWAGKKANSGMAFAWFCWNADHIGPAVIDRISWKQPVAGEPEKSPIPAMKGIATMAKTNEQTPNPDAEPDRVVEQTPKSDAEPDRAVEQTPKPDAEPDRAVEQNPKPAESMSQAESEQLDEEEKEFRALRCDLPGVKGASAAGIVTISVGKAPAKNEFFRTHKTFRPIIPIVDVEVGMERQFFAVTKEMVEPLKAIGITVTNHVLYLTVTSRGAIRIVPVRQADSDGEQNEYHRTKEIGLIQGMDEWVRLYTDQENRCYKVFPAPAGRFSEPLLPDLKEAKIFRLAFRDKGRLIDSVEHPLFKKWAARDSQ